MRSSTLFLASLLLMACSTMTDPERFADLECDELAELSGYYGETGVDADMFNDQAREAERHNSSSPWADRGNRAGERDTREQADKNSIRAAYRQKGCQP